MDFNLAAFLGKCSREASERHLHARHRAFDNRLLLDAEARGIPMRVLTPRVEAVEKLIRVVFNGVTIAETTHAQRVLETSHPPVYYLPPDGVRMKYLLPTTRQTVCEFKGAATYWTLKVDDRFVPNAAWSYEQPLPDGPPIAGLVAFWDEKVDVIFDGAPRGRAGGEIADAMRDEFGV